MIPNLYWKHRMNATAWLPRAPGDTGTSFWSTKLVRQCVLQLKGRKARCLTQEESFRKRINSWLVLYDPPPQTCCVAYMVSIILQHLKPLTITWQSAAEISWLSQDECFQWWTLTEGLTASESGMKAATTSCRRAEGAFPKQKPTTRAQPARTAMWWGEICKHDICRAHSSFREVLQSVCDNNESLL